MTDETTTTPSEPGFLAGSKSATDLLKNSRVLWEMEPGSVVKRRQVLYFRASEVIALLQERNDHMTEISTRLQMMVSRRRESMAKEKQRLDDVRAALAELIATEGCGCCSDSERHESAQAKLAGLLDVPMYEDGSGYDFGLYRRK